MVGRLCIRVYIYIYIRESNIYAGTNTGGFNAHGSIPTLDEYIEIRSREIAGVCIFDGNCIDAAHRSYALRRIN